MTSKLICCCKHYSIYNTEDELMESPIRNVFSSPVEVSES